MKITIVYESMFGNTHEVAQAIGDGVREAEPDADVECVPVGDASPELIKSTDLLVVGGPTHIRGMTSAFSRKIGVSGEEKIEAAGEPAHQMRLQRHHPGACIGEAGVAVQDVGDEIGHAGADDAAARDVRHVTTARAYVPLRGRALDDVQQLAERAAVLAGRPTQVGIGEQLRHVAAVVRPAGRERLDGVDEEVAGRAEQGTELI